MSGIWLLLGLLVLAYTGSMLVGGRALRGYGLPSGVEFVLLGFVFGPHLLDLAPRELVLSFEPLLLAALGWLGVGLGVDYGVVGERRTYRGSVAIGVGTSLVVAGFVFTVIYLVGSQIAGPHQAGLIPLALVLAVCLSETTRHAVRWVVERYGADGPVSHLLADISDTDDALPLLATAVVLAMAPRALPWDFAVTIGVTLGIGVLLGLITALLLGREFRRDETWGLMLGAAVLGIGLAARLELSPMAMMFTFGVTLVGTTKHRKALREMVGATERPVLLPMLVVAGTLIDLEMTWQMGVLIALGLVARLVMRVVAGFGLLAVSKPSRVVGPWIGLTTCSSGALSIAVGILFYIYFPGEIGEAGLLAATVSALVGELIGPASLRRGLHAAGEIREASLAIDEAPPRRSRTSGVTEEPPEEPSAPQQPSVAIEGEERS